MQAFSLTRSNGVIAVLFLLLMIPAVLVHLHCVVHPSDDAFITFRYVQNFLSGQGLVYNQNERVFGSTTPLYTFWLVALKSLFPGYELSVLSIRLNIIPFACMAAGVYALICRVCRHRLVAMGCCAYLMLSPLILETSISGMESMFFLSFMIWSMVATLSGRLGLGGFLAGCAMLSRPEGIFCLLPIAFMLDWRDRASWKAPVVGVGVPVLLWVGFASLYFGSPVPHSIIAKAAPLYDLRPGLTLSVLLDQLHAFVFVDLFDGLSGLQRGGIYVALLCALCYSWAFKRGELPTLAVGSVSAVVFLFYAYTNPLMMHWYWALVKVSAVLFFALGFRSGCQLLMESFPDYRSRIGSVAMGVFCLWAVAVPALEWLRYSSAIQSYSLDPFSMTRDKNSEINRIHAYREAGEWLNANRGETLPVVAAPEIGALGFAYRGPILDTCGLVSPRVVRYHPIPKEEMGGILGSAPSALIRELVPPIIVTAPGFIQGGILKDPVFRQRYQIVHKVPLRAGEYARSREILILEFRTDEMVESSNKPTVDD